MLPPDERLDCDDSPVGEVGFRLIVEDELVLVERAAKLCGERQPVRAVLVALGRVELTAAAVLLREVHRHVGALEQCVNVGAVLGVERDADARLEVERDAFERERPAQHRAHALAEHQRLAAVGDVRQQQSELVATEARDAVRLTQPGAQAPADLLQQQVAVVMPEGVVDLLEAVEVEDHQRDTCSIAPRRQDRLLGPVVEEASVREVGERVVQREVLVLGGLAAQPRRRARHDPEQRQIEQREAGCEEQVEPARVVRDAGGDRTVGKIQLEDAGRLAADAEPEWAVHLEEAAEASVARVLRLLQVVDVRGGLAGERLLEPVVGGGEPLADDRVVGRVDDGAVAVPDLDAGDLSARDAGPERTVEGADALRRQARVEVMGGESRPYERRVDELCGPARVGKGARSHSLGQRVGQDDAERRDGDEAREREAGQKPETRARSGEEHSHQPQSSPGYRSEAPSA